MLGPIDVRTKEDGKLSLRTAAKLYLTEGKDSGMTAVQVFWTAVERGKELFAAKDRPFIRWGTPLSVSRHFGSQRERPITKL